MENQKTIAALNTLIQINNDRFQSYDTVFIETQEQDLKTLFSQFMLTSQRCKQELVNEVVRLGGTATESTRLAGKFFRVWIEVKAALTGKNQKVILSSCEYGENIVLDTYQNVLNHEMQFLSFVQQTMINGQYALIKADHDKVKRLHDA
jgi:uncharacterized protein (TIGR02284 family)